MAHLYHLTVKSSNAKTGPIPVSTSSADLCPATCPFRNNGCYAASGPLALHWKKVTSGDRGSNWDAFRASIAALPEGQLWRHNQAGDIMDPGTPDGAAALQELTAANHGRRGYTYTHHTLTPEAVAALQDANRGGLTVNASTESEAAADAAIAQELPAVMVVPGDDDRRHWLTPAGNHVVTCPAQLRDDISCATCQLCQHRKPDAIIAFRAHGTGQKKATAALAMV